MSITIQFSTILMPKMECMLRTYSTWHMLQTEFQNLHLHAHVVLLIQRLCDSKQQLLKMPLKYTVCIYVHFYVEYLCSRHLFVIGHHGVITTPGIYEETAITAKPTQARRNIANPNPNLRRNREKPYLGRNQQWWSHDPHATDHSHHELEHRAQASIRARHYRCVPYHLAHPLAIRPALCLCPTAWHISSGHYLGSPRH